MVEESRGLERVFHAAAKHPGNPLIVKDREYEGWGPYLYGTVLRDGGKLRMWYQSVGTEGADVLYAESEDGIAWRKPDLGVVDYKGSSRNNIVVASNAHIPSVMPMKDAGPERRWAMFTFGGSLGPRVLYSPDGLRWSGDGGPTKLFPSSDVINTFYDPYGKRFVATHKMAARRHRSVSLAVSPDGKAWTKPTSAAVFTADDLDPDATQVYGMPVFPYQGMYIGLPWIYHARYFKYGRYSPDRMYEAQEGSPRTVDVQMAWSWDLHNWTRPPERRPFIGLGNEGEFDSHMVYTARAPVLVDDTMFFYYGGFDRQHDDNRETHGAIGLATLRLDGFCSMRAGEREGRLISRREVFNTPRVTINARTEPGGSIVAEILDREDRVIPGFGREDCIPFSGDSVRHELRWKTEAFPAELRDRDRKVRFILRKADLYSYLPADINLQVDDGFPDP